ncbi:dUTP diphosphatase [Candidatus Fermentibacteria bacterium]|nr:dUTP diphosphatase [Candidatus Fermentibacteria bacterium]
MSVRVSVRVLEHGRGLPLPAYATEGSSGMDLLAALNGPAEILPGERALVPTGICVAIPEGYEWQIRPRSGLGLSHGLSILNSPGTVDSDYRGEVQVLLVNLGDQACRVKRGDRIAQAVLAPVAFCDLVEVAELPGTDRGEGGFGHSGS